MFWGLILKGNRKYSQKIQKSFHLSQAALDVTSCSSSEPVQVVLTSDKLNYILCTLRRDSVEQVALDLNFAEGDEISFISQGSGNVHLSGYLVEDEGLDDFEDADSDLEIADGALQKLNKNKKKVAPKEEDNSDDSEDNEEVNQNSDNDDSDGEEEEAEDSDEDESEENSDDEEVQEPKPKQQKLEKPKQNGVDKQQTKKDKKEQKSNNKSLSEKAIEGGVKIQDLRVGNGPEAKPGKKIAVYYEGRLKSNNKVFDSALKGGGFKFNLGRHEVIKGWDVGVVGMKVGGKRRITCPPHMAYGQKGSPPVIPPNSTLVFDVELKNIN